MKRIRPAFEKEVIARYLANEYYQHEFNRDRLAFEHLILEPNLENPTENAIRRALFCRRRGHLWRELPEPTEWHEVELEGVDFSRIRVFPRFPWNALGADDLLINSIVQRIRSGRPQYQKRLLAKIHSVAYRLRSERTRRSAVMLVGIDERHPFTILEGNHRLTAAMLISAEIVPSRFQVFCGFSRQMNDCCWYDSNFRSLLHYAVNRLRNLWHNCDADLPRLHLPLGPNGLVTSLSTGDDPLMPFSVERE